MGNIIDKFDSFLLKLKQIVYIIISNIYKLSSMTLRYNPKIKKVDAFKAKKKKIIL